MSSQNNISKPNQEETDPLVATGSPDYLALCSLVLSAVGIDHAYNHQHTGLTVPEAYAVAARYHLDQYFEENREWPPRPEPVHHPRITSNPPTILTIGSLILFYWVTGPWQDNTSWFAKGAIDSAAILQQGEWWRLITALTLHADQGHLIGNCIIGGFIVHLLSKTAGYGLALLLLITCGALGNFLNIIARHQVHQSVGFSTAIFAAIGLFSGLQILTGPRQYLKNLLVPLGAGAALLAMLGTGGERTDLGAHLFGFLCGLGFGMLVQRTKLIELVKRTAWQLSLYILTLLMIIASWLLALSS